MNIYSKEISLAEKIINNNSVSYLIGVTEDKEPSKETQKLAVASFEEINSNTPNTEDLFYTRSVLVSTNLNLNDDYFDPIETWRARHTPVDKPTNHNHDEFSSSGHIVSQWVVDSTGNIIANDTKEEDLPDFFHICIGAVVYRQWRDTELKERAEELISKIYNDEVAVSMECVFSDFDYYATKDGERKIIERNDTSSFLTSHLRAYGGAGYHDGWKLGRVLRSPVFSAMGYVDNPANPNSQIFEYSDNISDFSFAANEKHNFFGVYTLCKDDQLQQENIQMSENLQAKLNEAVKLNEKLKEDLAKADVQRYESQVQDLNEELGSAKSELSEASKQKTEAEEAYACMCKQYEQLKAEKEELQAKFDELLQEQRSAKRLEAFIKKGYSQKEAEVEVAKLAGVNDEHFEVMAELIAPKKQEKVAPAFVSEEEEATSEEETKASETEVAKEQTTETKEVETVEVEATQAEQEKELLYASVASRFESLFNVNTDKEEK